MISEIKLWILVSVAGIMATVLGFVVKTVTDQVIKRLDEIVMELKQLTYATTIQGQQIQALKDASQQMQHRLDEHADRLRLLEHGQNK